MLAKAVEKKNLYLNCGKKEKLPINVVNLEKYLANYPKRLMQSYY
jgi:hypothetical protein